MFIMKDAKIKKTDNLPPTACCPVNAPNLKPVRLVGEVILRIQSYVMLQDSFSGSSEIITIFH